MSKILTEEQIAGVEARKNKTPEPPWFTSFDDAHDCPDHRDSGLARVDTGRAEDWPIARLCEWPQAKFIAQSRADIDAMVESHRALLEQVEELNFRITTLKQDQERVLGNNSRFQSIISELESQVRSLTEERDNGARWFNEFSMVESHMIALGLLAETDVGATASAGMVAAISRLTEERDRLLDPCAIAGHHVCGPSEIAHPDYRKVAEKIATRLIDEGTVRERARAALILVMLSELEKGGE